MLAGANTSRTQKAPRRLPESRRRGVKRGSALSIRTADSMPLLTVTTRRAARVWFEVRLHFSCWVLLYAAGSALLDLAR